MQPRGASRWICLAGAVVPGTMTTLGRGPTPPEAMSGDLLVPQVLTGNVMCARANQRTNVERMSDPDANSVSSTNPESKETTMLHLLGKDPNSPAGDSPTVYYDDERDTYVLQGWKVVDP